MPKKNGPVAGVSFWTIRQAASAVLKGGVIAYPTEAVYGLGCNPYDAQAVMRLLQIKHRDISRGLILLGRGLGDFADFIVAPDKEIRNKLESTWPGPVTWLLPARDDCPVWLRGRHSSIAIRVTDHAQSRALCDQIDSAIVSTSANRAGHKALKTALQVRQIFAGELDYILGGSTGGHEQPSQIRDAVTGTIIR